MISIRNYISADYPAVKALLQSADLYADTWESEENLNGMVKADPESILLATDGDKIVGNLFIVPFGPKVVHLFRLAVAKEYRKQGIASRLLLYAEELVKKKGIIELNLFVDAESKELREFYRKRNFVSSSHSYYALWKELSND